MDDDMISKKGEYFVEGVGCFDDFVCNYCKWLVVGVF